jgi:hypothetical protein
MARKKICSVIDCSEIAIRSLAFDRVNKANLNIETSRRAYLCRDHYKEFKKKIKQEQQLTRWRWSE